MNFAISTISVEPFLRFIEMLYAISILSRENYFKVQKVGTFV